MSFTNILSILLVLCPFSLSMGGTGQRIFWAGFSQSKDKPQTAPSVTWETQPVTGPITLDFNNLKDS